MELSKDYSPETFQELIQVGELEQEFEAAIDLMPLEVALSPSSTDIRIESSVLLPVLNQKKVTFSDPIIDTVPEKMIIEIQPRQEKLSWVLSIIKKAFNTSSTGNPYIDNLNSNIIESEVAKATMCKPLVKYLVGISDSMKASDSESLIGLVSRIKSAFSSYPEITLTNPDSITGYNNVLTKLTLFGIDEDLDFSSHKVSQEAQSLIKEWSNAPEPNVIRLLSTYIFQVLNESYYTDKYQSIVNTLVSKFNQMEGNNVLPDADDKVWAAVIPKSVSL